MMRATGQQTQQI